MNLTVLRQTWRAQRLKLLAVEVGLAIWGFLMPVIYATFGAQLKDLLDSGVFPRQFADFGGGDVLSLSGAIALGFAHPISVALLAVFAVGFSVAAIAGERQRGTLEVLLARPIGRLELYVTLLVAALLFLLLAMCSLIASSLVSSILWDVLDEIQVLAAPVVVVNALLLFGAFAAIGLAASVTFDRVTPALGITLAVVIVSYFLEVIGSLWPDAAGLSDYSLFHYLAPKPILESGVVPWTDMALLAAVGAVAVAYALVVFPRRDIAAPS